MTWFGTRRALSEAIPNREGKLNRIQGAQLDNPEEIADHFVEHHQEGHRRQHTGGRGCQPRLSKGRLAKGRLTKGWLTEGWLAEGWLAEGWLAEGRLTEGRLTEGRIAEGRAGLLIGPSLQPGLVGERNLSGWCSNSPNTKEVAFGSLFVFFTRLCARRSPTKTALQVR
jgi:hypothetical protein